MTTWLAEQSARRRYNGGATDRMHSLLFWASSTPLPLVALPRQSSQRPSKLIFIQPRRYLTAWAVSSSIKTVLEDGGEGGCWQSHTSISSSRSTDSKAEVWHVFIKVVFCAYFSLLLGFQSSAVHPHLLELCPAKRAVDKVTCSVKSISTELVIFGPSIWAS